MPSSDQEKSATTPNSSADQKQTNDDAGGAKQAAAPAKQGARSSSSGTAAKNGTGGSDAIALLSADHRAVEALFAKYEGSSGSEKDQLLEQICRALTIHAMIEEEIFYPACREAAKQDKELNEAQVEHDSVKILIEDLLSGASDDRWQDAKVKVLSEQVRHHVAEEEEPKRGIFAVARASGVDLEALGKELATRKAELERGRRMPTSEPVSISFNRAGKAQTKESTMASMQMRERDDRGRFMDDDDSRGGGRGGRGGRDDDNRGGSRGMSGRDRDDQGRFTSGGRGGRDDDDDRGGRGGRGGGGGGRGQGGWFGDSEGHSEAARRGWDDRGSPSRSGRGRDDDDDDRGGRGMSRGRSRDDDDDRGGRGGRSEGRGWFGDSEGHSEAARRGWDDRGSSSRSGRGRDDDDDDRGGRSMSGGRGRDDDDDRGGRGGRNEGRGWFGDSEGHSEAARRGWDDRGSSSRSGRGRDDDDDDRGGRSMSGGRSRSRDDDDDDRGGRGRGGGNGGWFGDSRGHSEASRRGWDNRH